jgi:uncharacterized membrane protein YidH (DUF202 family)
VNGARVTAGETVHDPALQQERTALAWDRTALGWLAAGALFLRAGGPPYYHPRHAPGLVALMLGVVLLATVATRYTRQRRVLSRSADLSSPWLVRTVGIGATLFSLSCLVLVIVGGVTAWPR